MNIDGTLIPNESIRAMLDGEHLFNAANEECFYSGDIGCFLIKKDISEMSLNYFNGLRRRIIQKK